MRESSPPSLAASATSRRRAARLRDGLGHWRCLVVGACVLWTAAAAQAQVRSGEPSPAQPAGVTVSEGRLSVSLRSATLREVMEEIARQAAIELRFRGSGGEATVSDAFVALPLEDGLRRLLGGTNYVVHHAGKGPARRVVRVTVYSTSGGTASRPRRALISSPGAMGGVIDARIADRTVEEIENAIAAAGATEAELSLQEISAAADVDLDLMATREALATMLDEQSQALEEGMQRLIDAGVVSEQGGAPNR